MIGLHLYDGLFKVPSLLDSKKLGYFGLRFIGCSVCWIRFCGGIFLFVKDSPGLHCQQVIPFGEEGKLKEAFSIWYPQIYLYKIVKITYLLLSPKIK